MRPYTVDSIPIDTNGQSVQADCVDITFVNYGTSDLIVNDSIKVPAPPVAGQYNFFQVAGNMGEIDRTKYTVRFSPGGKNDAVIIRRNYK